MEKVIRLYANPGDHDRKLAKEQLGVVGVDEAGDVWARWWRERWSYQHHFSVRHGIEKPLKKWMIPSSLMKRRAKNSTNE